MTRPTLHRQAGSWTNIASYAPAKPDLYASLAAVTLPDPKGGAMPSARAATPSGLSQSTLASCQHRIAIAIDALMWAVFAGCFVLLASGAL